MRLEVPGHPAAALLFQARKGWYRERTGELDEAFVYKVAKTPRGLIELAGRLDIASSLHEDNASEAEQE